MSDLANLKPTIRLSIMNPDAESGSLFGRGIASLCLGVREDVYKRQGVPFFGERDVAVIGLVGKTLFLERADRFVDRGLRHVELRRDVDRPDRHLRRASQHHDGFKVVLVRHGHFFHGTLLSVSYTHLDVYKRQSRKHAARADRAEGERAGEKATPR